MGWFKKQPIKILLVEDEVDIAESIKARLSLEDFQIEIARNGKEGVDKARAEKPDMIIMDVMMPVMDGYEACRVLKRDERTSHIPILVLTALPHVQDVETAFEAGANDFLNKPFSNDRLLEKVKKLLAK